MHQASSGTGRCDAPLSPTADVSGFTGSEPRAHLGAQVALAKGSEVPVLLDATILFAPVGEMVSVAMRGLDRGGSLAVAGIRLTDIPNLHYQDLLFQEEQLRSVTANTRPDGERFLHLTVRLGIRPTVAPRRFDEVSEALADLARDRITGAAVIGVDAS